MDKITPDEIRIKVCDVESIKQFNQALKEAGGGGYDVFKDKTVAEFMKIVSRNGVRLRFSGEWHMDRVNPSVELFTEAVNEIIEDRENFGPVKTIPKKKVSEKGDI